ncbi:MAG TPA: sulfite exporter TauE/SafE family protein [Puia sp.]|jgi:uncharacterized membrane protein YfcA|nr:sulfite exporter TauE/SafE family protein [Puia sp.]
MENILVLIVAGFVIGTFGTLIGAGGGFILVPLLILSHPQMPPEIITAVSIFIVAVNAISGSLAYARSGRIDYKAGLLFALFTIPGSILGVFATQYIPQHIFNSSFGILLILLAIFLFIKTLRPASLQSNERQPGKGWIHHSLTDKQGAVFSYTYNQPYGILVSVLVGFLSPLLGIGGGIIHVPAMVNWLQFPIYIATATSHFILAIMSTVSVVVHALKGSYNSPAVLRMVLALSAGVIPGAQLGAFLSHKIKSRTIIQLLAACLLLVGVRILLKSL